MSASFKKIALILLVLSSWLPIAAHAETFGEKRAYFKDWLTACRPTTGYCSATTYINPNPASAQLLIISCG